MSATINIRGSRRLCNGEARPNVWKPGRLAAAIGLLMFAWLIGAGWDAAVAQRTRKILVEITVEEPSPGFVRQVSIQLDYPQGGARISILPTGAEKLTRRDNQFIGEYTVPSGVRARITGTITAEVDDPAIPEHTFRSDEIDFTRPDSLDFKIARNLRFFPVRIEAVRRKVERGSVTDAPVAPFVTVLRRTGDRYAEVVNNGIRNTAFGTGTGAVDTHLYSEPFALPTGTEVELLGTLRTQSAFNLNAVATLRIPNAIRPGTRVQLVFNDWEADVRRAVREALGNAGIASGTAEKIGKILILPDARARYATWMVNQRGLLFDWLTLRWTWEGSYYIGLNQTFNLMEPNGGDSLMHEFTHETLYQNNWQPAAPPNPGHDIEVPASIETQAWEEGLCHFVGSHLLTRIVKEQTPIGHTRAEFWLDTPNDRVSERARGLRNQPSLNSPARTLMQNPGNWIEGVVTGSLLELYQELGYKPETNPEDVLTAFFADLRAFAAVVPSARWTAEEFFRYRAQNTRGRIPRFESRVIDQIALWYSLTTRGQVRDIDRLVPVTLQNTGAATVKKGEAVSLRASARAFHRLIGRYRNYGGASLHARLYEGTRQIGNDAPLDQPATVPDYSAAALLPATFSDPGAHRVRAEIWGSFVDGTLERLGVSDEAEITVEPETAEAVAITMTPASLTLEPEAVTTFTVTVTGTTNTAVMIEATKNGLTSEGGTLTQTGPRTWSYKAPSYEGTVLIKATSRADYKKSATATVTVKLPAMTGVPYGAKVVQLPCVWETGGTCNNNQVVYSFKRINNSSPMAVSLDIPPGLSAEALSDLPLVWKVEFSAMTTPERDSRGIDSLNCPPKTRPGLVGGGGLRGATGRVTGNQAVYQSTLDAAEMENAQVKIWLEVLDNVGRPPIYKWNYRQGERWLIYSGALPVCGPGGQTPAGIKPTPTPAPTPSAPLAVKLAADKTILGIGEQAKVRAQITGGAAPYRIYWQGEHAGEGEAVTFVSSKTGPQTLTASVTDAKGNGITASITLTVSGLEVILEKLAPSGGSVAFGSSASFAAKLRSGGQPVSGNYLYRWQPQPEVAFAPPEGGQSTATATFFRPGKVTLWVSVLQNKEGGPVTVAESSPLELTVMPPAMEVTFDQTAPFIGQETLAKVVLHQPIPPDRIAFKWELPPNAKLLREARDAREIAFLPSNDAPLTVTVRAAVPFYGDSLGEKSATLQARPYEVRAITVTQPPYSAGQNVEMLASIKPETAKSPVRFVWAVAPDSNNHIVGVEAGKTVTVSRSAPGMCAIVLEAFDSNGFRIGKDTTSFQVTVSPAVLDRAARVKQAAQQVLEAKEIVRKGKLDEAITLVEEASALDPANAEATVLGNKWKGERNQIRQHLARVAALMAESRFLDAQRELVAAQNLHYTYPPVEEAARQFAAAWTKYLNGVKEGLDAIRLANDAREFRKSLDLAQDMRAKWKLYDFDLAALNALEQEASTREAEKDRQRAILKRGETKLRQQDYAGAIADFDVLHAKGDFYQHWSVYQSEPHYYEKLRAEAHEKLTRINQLLEGIRRVVESPNIAPDMLEKHIANCDEVLALQAANAEAQRYRALLAKRLEKGRTATETDALLKQGADLYTQKKYAEAKAAFDRVIALQPGLSEAWRQRGMANRELKDYAGAVADYTRAIELDPQNHRAFTGRGTTKERNGDVRGALDDYSRALQLKPDYESAWFNRAFLKAAQKDHAAAIADYDRVLALNPKQASACNNRGVSKEALNDLNGAARDYERALELDPNYDLARRNLERAKGKLASAKEGAEDRSGISKERDVINLSGSAWNWFDPNADASYSLAGDSIVIRAPRKNDLWPATNFEAPRLTKTVAGDFSLTVRVRGQWRESYNGAGLAVSVGKDSVIRFERGVQGAVASADHVALFGFLNGREIGRAHILFLATDLYLKLERSGNQFTGFASANGRDWTRVGTVTASLPATVEAGLTLVNEYNSNIFQATFSNFELLRAVQVPPPGGTEITVFSNDNVYAVGNGPTRPTRLTLQQAHFITSIRNYHWNNGRGAAGGTISLQDADGKIYGPWNVLTSAGQGGVPNAYWTCEPNVQLPAGVFTVIDSDPATWARNSQSGGCGISTIKGLPGAAPDLTARAPLPEKEPGVSESRPVPQGDVLVNAILENQSAEYVHIFLEGESFQPANRLAPEETRNVGIKIPLTGRVKFIAGRNGQVLKTKVWEGDPSHPNRFPRVIFDRQGNLVIMTGLR